MLNRKFNFLLITVAKHLATEQGTAIGKVEDTIGVEHLFPPYSIAAIKAAL